MSAMIGMGPMRSHLGTGFNHQRNFEGRCKVIIQSCLVLHDWCNKSCGMCYPVCEMMHIKEPLLLIEKSSPCGGSGFPLSLSDWSFTICLTHIAVNKMC